MVIKTGEYNENAVIAIEGDINVYNIKDVKQKIEAVLSTTPKGLYIEVSGMETVSSVAIAVFFTAKRSMEATGRKCFLVNVNDDIKAVLKLSAIHFDMIDSDELRKNFAV
jgi:anti-anti-sigma factor